MREPGAEVVLVNIWATWCAPCREEFPDLMRLNERYRDRGLRLILVSADFEDQLPLARRFLAKQGVDFPSYLKTGDDMRFINAMDSRWTGALPATLIYDGRG
ncbi:MAG TPA: TlpA disulfide reductase family protein, partial [Candidatus Limnocylindria bacterium]|nr:TlpA disulfide reductase family protein [Candidatus Limnocylindria bacterium]